MQALNKQKVEELNEKNKPLQASQQKLESGGSVLSPQALAQLQKDIERQQVDIQRFTEDAQQEVTQLQQQLQDEFQRKLTPIIEQVASERQLHMMFSVVDSGLVWGDPALDLTPEIIKRFDAAGPARRRQRPPRTCGAARCATPPPRRSRSCRRLRRLRSKRTCRSHALSCSLLGSCSGSGSVRGSGFGFGSGFCIRFGSCSHRRHRTT